MTTAIAAREPIQQNAGQGHDDVISAIARVNAMACRGDAVLAEWKPRWRPTEEEIVRTAIAVILVALVAVIFVAGSAILTMG